MIFIIKPLKMDRILYAQSFQAIFLWGKINTAKIWNKSGKKCYFVLIS